MRNDSRRHILLGSAALVAIAIGGASPALAQTENSGNPNDNAASGAAVQDASAEDEAIVVTGFRSALESAVAEKKNRDQVVSVTSAGRAVAPARP